jgi:hypothetical protein
MDGWHVSKIYKHIIGHYTFTKSQLNLTHVVRVIKNQPNLT